MDLLQIRQENRSALAVLAGASLAGPFRGAVVRHWRTAPPARSGPAGDENRARTEIDLAMEGAPSEIAAGLDLLGRLLEEAARSAATPGGNRVYLEARATAEEATWRSLIVGGWVEPLGTGPAQRRTGSQGARLVLERGDWWEETALRELPLRAGAASPLTGGVTLTNHSDSPAHRNSVTCAAGDALGQMPAPVFLVVEGATLNNTGWLWAGQAVGPEPFTPLEDRDGTAGPGVTATVTADASASGGFYTRLSWNGTGEVTAWKADLPALVAGAYGGKAYLPVVRLHHPLAGAEQIWASWRLVVTWGGVGQTVCAGAGAYLPVGKNHCAGLPVFLPPWPLAESDMPPGLGLELRVQAGSAGAHALDLDCLHLLPLARWRIYQPNGVSSYGGLRVWDDPYRGTVQAGAWAIQMHQVEGPGLLVYPGETNRYFFLVESAAGGFAAGAAFTVRMFYRPRKRSV